MFMKCLGDFVSLGILQCPIFFGYLLVCLRSFIPLFHNAVMSFLVFLYRFFQLFYGFRSFFPLSDHTVMGFPVFFHRFSGLLPFGNDPVMILFPMYRLLPHLSQTILFIRQLFRQSVCIIHGCVVEKRCPPLTPFSFQYFSAIPSTGQPFRSLLPLQALSMTYRRCIQSAEIRVRAETVTDLRQICLTAYQMLQSYILQFSLR